MNHIQHYEKELRLRNYCDLTIRCYSSMVRLFLIHFEIDPHNITEEQIKDYLHQSSSTALLKQRIGAIKRFYEYVVKQPLKFKHIQYPRREEHLPVILSIEEIKRMFNMCENSKHKAILYLLYSTGMRESEVLNLRITDIDSSRMLIHLRQAKGKKDRFVKLSEPTLKVLREYYKEYKPKTYLFNGQFSEVYSVTSIRNFVKKYARLAGIKKRVYPHLIRHCTATHMLEAGVDVAIIQKWYGHKQQKTTMRYARMSNRLISSTITPDCFI